MDPSKRKTGGALLGDRIRMNAIHHPNVYMRSLATRRSHTEIPEAMSDIIQVAKAAGFERPILHCLCFYGIAARVAVKELAGDDPARFKSLDARFAKVVMPAVSDSDSSSSKRASSAIRARASSRPAAASDSDGHWSRIRW